MKRIFALIMVMLLVLSLSSIAVSAADKTTVTVSISDKDGKLVIATEQVTVTDKDADGTLTINDALIAAHDSFYDGGAAAGYATETTQFGLGLKTLWGATNGGSYGYYLNNSSAMSLSDPVADGDYLMAYVFTDLATFSDTYSYFDCYEKEVTAEDEITLTLSAASFDESWAPITIPVPNASVTVDGEVVGTTDAGGKVTFTLNTNGEHIVSATSADMTLVPPVCKVTVTGNASAIAWEWCYLLLLIPVLGIIALICFKRKKKA